MEYKQNLLQQQGPLSVPNKESDLKREALEFVGVIPSWCSNSSFAGTENPAVGVLSCKPVGFHHIEMQWLHWSTWLAHKSKACQICMFEGCGLNTRYVQYCVQHQICACTSIVDSEEKSKFVQGQRSNKYNKCSDWSWCCPNKKLIC